MLALIFGIAAVFGRSVGPGPPRVARSLGSRSVTGVEITSWILGGGEEGEEMATHIEDMSADKPPRRRRGACE